MRRPVHHAVPLASLAPGPLHDTHSHGLTLSVLYGAIPYLSAYSQPFLIPSLSQRKGWWFPRCPSLPRLRKPSVICAFWPTDLSAPAGHKIPCSLSPMQVSFACHSLLKILQRPSVAAEESPELSQLPGLTFDHSPPIPSFTLSQPSLGLFLSSLFRSPNIPALPFIHRRQNGVSEKSGDLLECSEHPRFPPKHWFHLFSFPEQAWSC